jgi:hypothetical protein
MLEIIEQLSGQSSPRPWSIVAGESGEGVIGDASGVEIAGASMADCAVIVRAVNSHDCLRADLARVTAERDEADDALAVAEKDRDEARDRCAVLLAERDEARAEMEAMRELLADSWPCRCGHPLCKRCKHDDEVRDALRARKVGG